MTEDSIIKITIHKALTCNADENVKEIAKKLKDSKDRRIFVVDKQDKLIGIITTTDLVYKTLCDREKSSEMKASDVMVNEVKAVDLSEDFEKALEIMNELKTFTCPVTDKEKMVGVISYHELVNYIFTSLQK
ncbi:MAG: CBS domain-containing protein [Nanoarchaeota archaeon]